MNNIFFKAKYKLMDFLKMLSTNRINHYSFINTLIIGVCLCSFLACSSVSSPENELNKNNKEIAEQGNLFKNGRPKKLVSGNKKNKIIRLSKSKDSHNFMKLRRSLGTLNAFISVSHDSYSIKQEKTLIDNVIHSAEVSKDIPNNHYSRKDHYKGWVSRANNATKNLEEVEYEGYLFSYVAQFLYLLKENGWIRKSQKNRHWWKKTLAFVEKNEWKKWYSRSKRIYHKPYREFLRVRTHMGARWATFAIYINAITNNPNIKKHTKTLIKQYNRLLKRNLKTKGNRYVWHSTYDNVSGTDAGRSSKNNVQDLSHGNHVVTYIVAAYELGNPDWNLNEIHKLCNTLKYVYNHRSNSFADNVDGSSGNGRGNFVEDGWVKLARYSDKVKAIFKRFKKSRNYSRYNPGPEYDANLHRAEVKSK
jgi:hypothetical protein